MRPRMDQRELKMVLTANQAARVLACGAGHLSEVFYDRSQPVSYTRTTYLDTEAGALLHGDGSPLIRRVRIREYASAANGLANPALTGACYIELKQRVGDRRVKTRARIAAGWAARMLRGDCGYPAWLPHHLELQPQASVVYRRRSYRESQTGLRITLDSDLTIGEPTVPGAPIELQLHPPQRPRILEVKGSGPLPEWLRTACVALGVTPVSLSKYQLAMDWRRRRVTTRPTTSSSPKPAPGDPLVAEQAVGP